MYDKSYFDSDVETIIRNLFNFTKNLSRYNYVTTLDELDVKVLTTHDLKCENSKPV